MPERSGETVGGGGKQPERSGLAKSDKPEPPERSGITAADSAEPPECSGSAESSERHLCSWSPTMPDSSEPDNHLRILDNKYPSTQTNPHTPAIRAGRETPSTRADPSREPFATFQASPMKTSSHLPFALLVVALAPILARAEPTSARASTVIPVLATTPAKTPTPPPPQPVQIVPVLPGEIVAPLPREITRPLPGQVVRALPGQLTPPLPGQIVRALPGQIVPPLPGQIVR